jgi:ribosome biogenesis GTPase
VAVEHQHVYRIYAAQGELLARVSGRFRHTATGRSDYPAVGDWVVARPRPGGELATIDAVLPRRSRFSRKVAGSVTEEQVVAANIDTVFLLSGLDQDFSVRRLERYLTLAHGSGARPVVLLTKSDLTFDVEARAAEARAVAQHVPVHAISARARVGLDALTPYLERAATIALLGSSGVGKSTLINWLVGQDVQRTREVRAHDDRGQHTTTTRELVVLPGGALMIDTPGMRELQLWDAAESLQESFDDIDELARFCHFPNCTHRLEPRCAVRQAVEAGGLSESRLEHFRRLQGELARLSARQDKRAQLDAKRKIRSIHKAQKRHQPRN